METITIQEIADTSDMSSAELIYRAKKLNLMVDKPDSKITQKNADILVEYTKSGKFPEAFVNLDKKKSNQQYKLKDIAKDLNTSNQNLLDKAVSLGIDAKSPYSLLKQEDVDKLRKYFENEKATNIKSNDENITSEMVKNIEKLFQQPKRKRDTFKENKKGDNKTKNNRTRNFTLPAVQNLNKEQDAVLRLPEDGQYLIFGGPGTGKSVVALLRTLKYHKNNNYQFLVYNHMLNAAILQYRLDFHVQSWTLMSWVWIQLFKIFGRNTPTIGQRELDYKSIIAQLQDESCYSYKESDLHLIIDEGQDAPKELYDMLWHMGIVNFFVVADQNQQITDKNSNRKDLINILSINKENLIELKQNYRNTDRIAIFSQCFYTDPAIPPPEIPSNKPSLDTPVMYEYSEEEQCAKLILREADKNIQKLIGVITRRTSTGEKFVELLTSIDIELDHSKAKISTYDSKDNKSKEVGWEYQERNYRKDNFVTVAPKKGHRSIDVNFTEGGIVVLTDTSVKGLEFDIVYIIVDDFTLYGDDEDSMKKKFYVMSSRAIDKLVLFKKNTYSGDIEQILPNDESILKRGKI